MATGTANRSPQPTPPRKKPDGKWLQYDTFIDTQIRKARGQVKGVELAGALLTLAFGCVLFFLAAALVDHWVFPGGLNHWGRLAFCILFVGGLGWYVVRRLVPLCIRRINPTYAAQTIEKGKPTLKNALVNFLFLREDHAGVSERVFQAVEEQAATSLSRVSVEATVDRSRVVRLGYLLLAAVAIFGIYCLASPKNPFATIGRVVMPWADIQQPTRVTIADVQPGSRTAYLGEAVEISAEVRGNGADEPVRVLYSTADGQTIDKPVVMTLPPNSYRHTAKIPAEDAGLQQNITYRIEAGDAVSPTFTLQEAAAPVITIDSIDYQYPAYTERAPVHVENKGDVQALEGTTVTIHGHANQPLHNAVIVLAGEKGRQERPMRIEEKSDGKNVVGSFTLALADREHGVPQFTRYMLRPDGREKPEPVQYRINVFPDLAPEIKFLAPDKEEFDLPSNGRAALELRAVDDIALSEVTLSAVVGKRALLDKQPLLQTIRRGPFDAKYVFDAAKFKLNDGDLVEYWANARDNRQPAANEAQTVLRRIRIVQADRRRSAEHQPGETGPENPEMNDNPADNSHERDSNPDQPQRQPNEQRPERKPGEKTDHQNQQTDKNQNISNPDNATDNKPDEQQNTGNPQHGDPRNDPGKNNPQEKRPPSKQNPDHKQQPDNKTEQQSKDSGPQESAADQKGADSSQQKSGGSKSGGNQSGGEKQQAGGQKNSDKQESTGQQNGSDGSSGSQSGEQNSGGSKSGSQNGGKSGSQQDKSSADDQGQQSPPSDTAEAIKQVANAKAGDKPNDGSKSNDGAKSGDNSKPNDGAKSNDGSKNSPSNSAGEKQQPSKQNSPNKSENNPSTGQQKPGDQKSADQKPGSEQNNSQKPNEQKSAGQPNGNQQQPGAKSSDQPNQNRNGQQKAGDKPGDKQAQADGGSPQPSDKQNSTGAPKRSSDQKHAGENQRAADQQKPSDQSQQGSKPQPGSKTEPGDKSQTSEKQPSTDQTPTSPKSPNDDPSQRPDNRPGEAPNGQNPQQGGTPKSGDQHQPGSQQQPGEKSKSGEHQPGDQSPQQNPGSQNANSQQQPNGSQQNPSAEKRNENSNGESKQGLENKSADGQGAQAAKGSQPSQKPQKPDEKSQSPNPDAKGGDAQSPKGNSVGDNSDAKNKSGSPAPQEGMKPNENKPDDANAGKSKKAGGDDDQAQSPSTSPKESSGKTKGENDGDRSGQGGKAGGGESSKQEGTGGPGQKTASDEGHGQAQGPGKGDTSNQAGGDKQSDHATGNSGEKTGNGASQRPAGDNPSGHSAPNQSADVKNGTSNQPGTGNPSARAPTPDDIKGNSTAFPDVGGGGQGNASAPPPGAEGPGTGDKANEEFAKKQFDLALNRLKKANPDMLRELHWSREDAQRLADRLEQMKAAAKDPTVEGNQARRELDDLYRSLGSRTGQLIRRGDRNANDEQRGLFDAHDNGPPADYADQFDAFQKGAARGK